MSPRRGVPARRGGFALPLALVVLVLLSMMSATGLYVARGDFRAAEATRHAAVALAAADAGAARTIARWPVLVPTLPPPGDSLVFPWTTLPDSSQYRAVVVRAPIGVGETPSMRVLLRSTGRLRAPADARRTVVAVVEVAGGAPPCCTTSIKVSSGLDVGQGGAASNAGFVDGRDRVPPGWTGCTAPLADQPGVISSDTTQVLDTNPSVINGAPRMVQDPTVDPTDFTALGSTTYAAISAIATARFTTSQTLRNAIGPVVTGGVCQTANNRNWGSPLQPTGPCGSHFPIIHVAGSLTLQGAGQGQGILLVDGDFTIQDNFQFYGVVIVLGTLRIRGPAVLYGGIMARGGAAGTGGNEIRNLGQLLYSGCAVQRALATLPASMSGGGITAREQSWFEPIG